MKHIETVIVGGGQAGLGTSYYLTQQKREHVILEASAQAGKVWREERWDSFTLVTPNWTLKLPGAEYNGADPHGFMPRNEIVDYFDRYVKKFQLPIQCNTRVISVEPMNANGYRIETSDGSFRANHVVIATGFFQAPKIPSFANQLSGRISQLHSSAYRNPQSLPEGAVLVIGSAQSGSQIAEELNKHGRKVFLCTGSAGRAPRRYRGKDIIEWLHLSGFFDLTSDQMPPGMGKFKGIPHLSGTNGGHTINLHQFARGGVTLLGHLRGISNNKIFVAPDLKENLKKADQFEQDAVNMIDGFIKANGLILPTEDIPQLQDGFQQPIIETLDCDAENIRTVIWAIGYTFDYSLVKLPVRDADGFPIQMKGITNYPGLYFVGMPWMPSEKSGALFGFWQLAEYIVTHIAQGALIR